MICSGSSKIERADKLKFISYLRPVDSGLYCKTCLNKKNVSVKKKTAHNW